MNSARRPHPVRRTHLQQGTKSWPNKRLIFALSAAVVFWVCSSESRLSPARASVPDGSNRASAQAAPVIRIPYEMYTLRNGLEVILSEDHQLPLVAVNIWYHVGPANERPGRTGFAHLFEHLMFEGSKHVGERAHFKYLETAGGNEINGNTDFDRTSYFETVPSNQLELALWLESDRMGFLAKTLDVKKLATQKRIVRNERRQKTENEAYGLADEEVFHLLFPEGHPYHAHVIGSHTDIQAARLDDVREFFETYYVPNNASLVIAGDLDKTKTKAYVEKYFGPLPAGKPVPQIEAHIPQIPSERRSIVTDKVELPRVYIAWITDPIYGPHDAELQLLAQILASGKASRLYKKLIDERQIAQDVYAEQYSQALGSIFYIQVTGRPGVQPEQLEKAIDRELQALQLTGPSQDELAAARNMLQSHLIFGLERLGGLSGLAQRLNQYNQYLHNPGYLPHDLQRYSAATPAGVQAAARNELTGSSRVVVFCVPGQKKVQDPPESKDDKEAPVRPVPDTAFDTAQSWRDKPPAPGPDSVIKLPAPTRFELPNGMSVLLVEAHTFPVVTANVVALSGSDANPPDKPGLASFVVRTLQEGTTTRSGLRIAKDTARLGAEFGATSNSDASTIYIRCLKQEIPAGLDLLSDIVQHPAFADDAVERIRKERITSLLQDHDDPRWIAVKAFYRAAYGENHPYGYTEDGTRDSLQRISAEDLKAFWSVGYAPHNAALIIAGDIGETEARSLANKYFGAWHGLASTNHAPIFHGNTSRKVIIIDKPGSRQTSLLIGQIGIPRSSSGYVPVEIMNSTLGGLFSARLNMNLREEHGYTYGAFSRFVYRRGPGPFVIRLDVRTDVTGAAVEEVFKELQRIQTVAPSEAELKMSRDSMAHSLPELFATTLQIARTAGSLYIYGLPLDYYTQLPSMVEKVTAEDAQRAATAHLQPDSMIVVAVGDRAKIEPGLKALNLGLIEHRNLDGELVPESQSSAAIR